MMTIRPFVETDDEYRAVLNVSNTLWPEEAEGFEEFKYNDQNRDKRYLQKRFVGELDGEIVAVGIYADCRWSHVPGKYLVFVDLLPQHHGNGYGSQFYDFLVEELKAREPHTLVSWTREDKPQYVRFLTKRGYEFAMRYAVSRLDVEAFDPSEFDYAPRKMKELGVEIHSLPEIAEMDPDWKRSWYELQWELFQDVPSVDPPTKQTFEQFCKRFNYPSFSMDAHWFAKDGDRYVGYSGIWLSEADKSKLYTGLTGVVRTHRRKGVATALKLRGFQFAKDYGAKVIETDNEENNPMFALNQRLGFKAVPAWIEYRLVLDDEAAKAANGKKDSRVGGVAEAGDAEPGSKATEAAETTH